MNHLKLNKSYLYHFQYLLLNIFRIENLKMKNWIIVLYLTALLCMTYAAEAEKTCDLTQQIRTGDDLKILYGDEDEKIIITLWYK
jgi:hypothetical protein